MVEGPSTPPEVPPEDIVIGGCKEESGGDLERVAMLRERE